MEARSFFRYCLDQPVDTPIGFLDSCVAYFNSERRLNRRERRRLAVRFRDALKVAGFRWCGENFTEASEVQVIIFRGQELYWPSREFWPIALNCLDQLGPGEVLLKISVSDPTELSYLRALVAVPRGSTFSQEVYDSCPFEADINEAAFGGESFSDNWPGNPSPELPLGSKALVMGRRWVPVKKLSDLS